MGLSVCSGDDKLPKLVLENFGRQFSRDGHHQELGEPGLVWQLYVVAIPFKKDERSLEACSLVSPLERVVSGNGEHQVDCERHDIIHRLVEVEVDWVVVGTFKRPASRTVNGSHPYKRRSAD